MKNVINLGGSQKERQNLGVLNVEEANRIAHDMIMREADIMVKAWIKVSGDIKLQTILKTLDIRDEQIKVLMRMEDQFRRAILNVMPIVELACKELKEPVEKPIGLPRLAQLNEYLQKILDENKREDDKVEEA